MKKLLSIFKKKNVKVDDISIDANGSIELEEIVREKIQTLLTAELEGLAKTYYRDIKVGVNVNIK